MSLMFPTIYGLALGDIGPDAEIGSAGLIMAILGGSLFPPVQALLMDAGSPALSFLVPMACFTAVLVYALRQKSLPVQTSVFMLLLLGTDRWTFIGTIAVTILVIIFDKGDPGRKVAWLMVVILLPLLGIVLYICFGFNQRHHWMFNRRHRQFVDILQK